MAEPHALLADRYRLVREVGRGGMGVVWEAWDERLERPVAVKELRPQLGLPLGEAELAKDRAMREARITARLHHRNAVPVFDVVEHEGQPCLIMQFVPSVPLSVVLREGGPLGVPEAARFAAGVASALAAAHALGIVHRDVKPGNILITDDGTALISDFGISHALGDATLTSTGLVHGTPAYLAPEVARGAESSSASDVFSLGATLYACLEGGPPFGTDANSIALLYRVASGELAPPQRAGRLTPVLLEMLRSDPALRPAMKEVASRLAAGESADALPTAAPALPVTEAAPEVPGGETGTTQVRASAEPPTTAATRPAVAATAGAAPLAPLVAEPPSVPAPGSRPPARRRRGAWVAVAVLLVALVVLGTAAATGRLGFGGGGAAAPVPAGSRSARATSDPSSGSAPSGSASERSEAPSASSTRPTPSASPSPSSGPTSSPSPNPTSSSGGEPTAGELEDAITGYYALVPGNTDEAWRHLTKDYQRNPSGGRQSYESFWKAIDRVSVSKVEATPPSRVEATVTYRRGTAVEVDRTSFRLVRDDGILKIAGSGVLGRG